MGTVLMLPLGAIVAFVLIIILGSRGGYYPGEFLLLFVGAFAVMFVVRWQFRRSRRKYWQQRWSGNGSVRILRERYARGEITADEFRQKLRDLRRSRRSDENVSDEPA